MSITPANDENYPDGHADRQTDALKDQLRKDVASWSAARSGGSAREAAELSVPVIRQPALPPAKRVKRQNPVSPVVNPVSARKKPFGMSYDGVTEADYITYMLARGAR